MRARLTLPLVFSLLLVPPPGTAAAQPAGRDALVGAWQLDYDLTSTPPDIDPAPVDDGKRPRAGIGDVGGRFGPGRMGGSFGGGQAGAHERQKMRTLLRRAGDAPARLTLVMDGARVLLTDGQGRTTTLTTDNRPRPVVTVDGEADVRARWQDDALVVEEDFGSRMKLIYHHAATTVGETRQLRVTVAIEGVPSGRDRGGSPVLTRVYNTAG